MQTIAQTVRTHESRNKNAIATIQPLEIDIERNLLTILEELAEDLAVPESASDIEACLIIAEYVKGGSMAPR